LKDRFGHVITTDEKLDAKYLVAAALDPNTARSLDFTAHELSGFVLEMVNYFEIFKYWVAFLVRQIG
jgi:hypothetical protein